LRKPLLYILAIFFFCCEEAPDFLAVDSVDAPVVEIQTSETIFTELPIEIEWEGNATTREFVYKLQYVDSPTAHNWSELDTTSETSITFDSLDEGNYTFFVHGLYNQDVIGDVETFSFTVNAIFGPALRIYPLNQTANVGDEIDVYLYFEDVLEEFSVTGLHVDIQINSDELEFIRDQFESGELIDSFPGTIYPNPSYSNDNTSVSIIIGVVDDINQNGLGIYGTGSIAKIRLKVLTCCGGQNININQIDVLNFNGDPYNNFNDPVSGTVTVE